jgi:hypothetical protein
MKPGAYAVLRPPWWPPRTLPRAGSPLVRPAGCTRRPTGGVGTGDFSLWLTPTATGAAASCAAGAGRCTCSTRR